MPERTTFNHAFLDAFQIEDIAKLCMKRGGVLSWEQGLGKTIGAMLYAKAVKATKALFIVPQDIAPQWIKLAREKLLTDLRPIADARDVIRVREQIKSGFIPTGHDVTRYPTERRPLSISNPSALRAVFDSTTSPNTGAPPSTPSRNPPSNARSPTSSSPRD